MSKIHSGTKEPVILFPYAGETIGGSVNSSFLLVHGLLERNHRVIVALHGEGPTYDLAKKSGFPTYLMPSLGRTSEMDRKDGLRLGNYLKIKDTFGAIKTHDASIIHVNDKRMLRTYTVPALLKRKILLNHWRSVYKPSYSVDFGLRAARKSVSVSHYSRALLPQWVQARTEVVYNPFHLAKADPAARVQLRDRSGIPGNAAVIGCFGTLQARKRPSLIFDMLDAIQVTADGRPVYGLVCGGWAEPRDAAFEAGLKSGRHAGRLIWPGHVDNALAWMSTCDAVILPAIDEPLSRVGVEAQSLGIPPIVSSDGGLKEVVDHGQTGFVIDPYDTEGWVAHVQRILDEPGLAQAMAPACIASASRLSVDRHVDRISAIYVELLAGQT